MDIMDNGHYGQWTLWTVAHEEVLRNTLPSLSISPAVRHM